MFWNKTKCQTFRITFWLAALWVLPVLLLLWFLLLLLFLFLLFLCRQDTRHFDYLFNNFWFIFGKHAVVKSRLCVSEMVKNHLPCELESELLFFTSSSTGVCSSELLQDIRWKGLNTEYMMNILLYIDCFRVSSQFKLFSLHKYS